jgi:hypothetical protein
MSVPLDRLYHFVDDIAQDVFQGPVIIYRFYPHGSKNIENMEPLLTYSWQDRNWYPALYCNDQEPLDYDRYENVARDTSLLDRLPHFLRSNSVYKKNLLLHSEKSGHNIEKYQQNQFIPVYWWSHAAIALDWFRYAKHVNLKRQRAKTFLVYNRAWSGTREYRVRFAELLLRSNLQDHCHTSFNPIDPELGIHYRSYKFKNTKWQITKQIEDYFPTNQAHSYSSADFVIEDYESTEIEVVLETLFDDDRSHLTEKSLRPIALGQPFIMAGTAGSLEYLRSYGFKTFADVWDETYDTVLDPEKRLCAIISLMQQILDLPENLQKQKVTQAQQIADFNRQHFFSRDFFNQVHNELRANLKSAFEQVALTKNYQDFLDRWERYLKNSKILDQVTNETRIDVPNLSAVNRIKSLIDNELDAT